MLAARMLAGAKQSSEPVRAVPESILIVQPVEDLRNLSFAAAKAIICGRFENQRAVAPEFKGADINLVQEYLNNLQQNEEAVDLCKREESVRCQQLQMKMRPLSPMRTTLTPWC